MRPFVISLALSVCLAFTHAHAQEQTILPTRPIPPGKAPHMQVKLVKDTPEEKVYAVIFLNVDEALSDAAKGAALPFTTIDKSTSEVIGSTRFANFDIANRHVEIGWTWITPAYQRTYVNSEAKYLMLSHAFDVWECARVELKTDVLNTKSRNAMLRMGATEEGALRKHVLAFNNRWRDTIYYSVLDTEWPEVKARLKGFTER